MPLPLSEVFPDEDYRFHLTLRPGDVDGFFRSTTPGILAERQRWLAGHAGRHLGVTDDAGPLVAEFDSVAARWTGVNPLPHAPVQDRLRRLGAALEPDFLLLAPDGDGTLRLRAGVVCFPSSWALEEKIGHALETIHDPVPGLNPALAPGINRFLSRLKPGMAFERANWGAAATDQLNMHPALALPRITPPLAVDRVWIRIEDQLLARLPAADGVLFAIRLRILPLAQILGDAELRRSFVRAVATMPMPVVAYKGLTPIREALV